MNNFEAFILGLIQGLSEFLPVSSSGHIEIGKHILGTEIKVNVIFTVILHIATVLSTLVVFRKDIIDLFKGVFQFKWNESTEYVSKILISMVPVGILGVFFKDYIESFFDGNIAFVGAMLIVTALLLTITLFVKQKTKDITYKNAVIVGIAQAIAVLPGLSRSGATIATGLLVGIDKSKIAKFSFLMVIIPILGEGLLELIKGDLVSSDIGIMPLIIGFSTAFIIGLIACKLMINIVKNSKLIYFAIYCFIVGIIAIII